MVKIKKGTEILVVTCGAFQEYFKGNGWEIWREFVDSPALLFQKQDELDEKPLSEMTVAELKIYAKKLNIDLKSEWLKDEVIAKIKEKIVW